MSLPRKRSGGSERIALRADGISKALTQRQLKIFDQEIEPCGLVRADRLRDHANSMRWKPKDAS